MKPWPFSTFRARASELEGEQKENYNTERKLDESITEYFNKSGTKAMALKVELQR